MLLYSFQLTPQISLCLTLIFQRTFIFLKNQFRQLILSITFPSIKNDPNLVIKLFLKTVGLFNRLATLKRETNETDGSVLFIGLGLILPNLIEPTMKIKATRLFGNIFVYINPWLDLFKILPGLLLQLLNYLTKVVVLQIWIFDQFEFLNQLVQIFPFFILFDNELLFVRGV